MDVLVWEREENFKKSKEQLIKNVLSDSNGKPYKHFEILRLGMDYCVDWENEKIQFNSFLARYENISAATHELGHLMISPNDGIGQNAWGLKNPYMYFTGLSIDPSSPKNNGQLKTESKAWAWQYLIECLAGFREFGSEIPPRPEAKYLADGGMYLNKEKEMEDISLKSVKTELNSILEKHPDWKSVIQKRMESIGLILKEMKKLQLNADDCLNKQNIKTHICNDVNEGYIQKIEHNIFPKGWHEVILKEEENGEEILLESICFTQNSKKAERFFNIAVKENSEILEENDDYQSSFKI